MYNRAPSIAGILILVLAISLAAASLVGCAGDKEALSPVVILPLYGNALPHGSLTEYYTGPVGVYSATATTALGSPPDSRTFSILVDQITAAAAVARAVYPVGSIRTVAPVTVAHYLLDPAGIYRFTASTMGHGDAGPVATCWVQTGNFPPPSPQ